MDQVALTSDLRSGGGRPGEGCRGKPFLCEDGSGVRCSLFDVELFSRNVGLTLPAFGGCLGAEMVADILSLDLGSYFNVAN